MSDHDPPFEPLRPLDPMAPDPQEDVGRLEPIDPEADDAASVPAPSAATPAAPVGAAPSPGHGNGLAVAVALAVLLSLSSIAAIGGLVAISMQTVAPAVGSTAVAPVESGGPVATIHVGEAAQGPRESRDEGDRSAPSADSPEAPTASPVPASGSPGSGIGGGTDGIGKGDGHRGGGKGARGAEGAWCDARQGSSCDAVVGGMLQPEGDGYVPTDEELGDTDADADWDDDAPGHSGFDPSHGHGKH